MDSRYFVTVRRAMSMFATFSISAMRWSESGRRGSSFLISRRIRSFTLSLATAVALHPVDARVEEVLELEDALGRVHVLVGRHPADRRLVHLDVVGDVAQVQRLQEVDAPSRRNPAGA